jgi:hypothetical protein
MFENPEEFKLFLRKILIWMRTLVLIMSIQGKFQVKNCKSFNFLEHLLCFNVGTD